MLAWTCVHSRDASLLVAHAHTGLINQSNQPTRPPIYGPHPSINTPNHLSMHTHTQYRALLLREVGEELPAEEFGLEELVRLHLCICMYSVYICGCHIWRVCYFWMMSDTPSVVLAYKDGLENRTSVVHQRPSPNTTQPDTHYSYNPTNQPRPQNTNLQTRHNPTPPIYIQPNIKNKTNKQTNKQTNTGLARLPPPLDAGRVPVAAAPRRRQPRGGACGTSGAPAVLASGGVCTQGAVRREGGEGC